MRRIFTMLTTMAVAVGMSGVASAQHGHGGGRPATTGLEHAEATANPHGQQGIENAEAKQAEHKRNDAGQGKNNGKRKHKKHNKSH